MFAVLALSAALALTSSPDAVPAAPTPAATAQAVAFQRLEIADGDGPMVEIGVWTPAGTDEPRPLIVVSHGNGGDFRSHEATARALAASGFVVAALTHTGDNWRDHSRATDVAERPRQLARLIDFMLTEWEGRDGVDAARVGAFGFSSGGFTVLTAAGGRPDLGRMIDHCRANPGFYDCRLAATGVPPVMGDWTHDRRIRAVVAAAPALGYTLGGEGLSGVTQPVQLWRAGADEILPSPFYAEAVRDALPEAPEYHVAEGARHFDFLPPCSERLAALAPAICTPTPGFDRAAFQDRFNAEVIGFFQRTLR